MIVTSVPSARAIWLFDVMDLTPRGQYIYDRLFPWLVERYDFAKAPTHARDQVDNAWEFLDGKFVNSANTPINVNLRVYNDGVVSETRSSTDDSEGLLADVLTAAVRELGLTFTESMVHRRMYVSELNLASDKGLEAMNPRMREFSNVVSEAFGMKCEPTSLAFGGEPTSQPIFRFERKLSLPFSQNKYWSLASLSTSVHLALLEQLEALLTA